MPSLFFIRHGQREDFEHPLWRETAANPDDTPLSQTGFAQAEEVGRALADKGIDVILCSPFLRALQTAVPLARMTGLPILVEPGFCEWLNPAWFAKAPGWMNAKEIRETIPEADTSHPPLLVPTFPEESESETVYARCGEVLERMRNRWPTDNIAVFSHGSPTGQSIACLLGTLEGIDLHVGAITHIIWDSQGSRLISSDRTHLSDKDESLRFH